MQDQGDPRWEYRLLWRYGPISLVAVGAALLAIGLSGLCATAVSVTVLPIGLVCLLAGVVLPRIEGAFTAGPQGITATLLAAHKIDACYTVTGPAVEAVELLAPVQDQVLLAPGQPDGPVLLGDVWDALDKKVNVPGGFRSLGAACGTAYLVAPDGREFALTNRGFLDWRPASSDLLELLVQWGVRPVASGRYPVPPYADPGTVSARLVSPEPSSNGQ
jgi:hypothetical protein